MDDATDRVTAAIQSLFRLGGSRRIHQQQAGAAGVSISQQALRVLERVIADAPTTPGQLATWLDLDPAVVTRLLRQLEESGFVRRQRSLDDGRMSTVEATAEGRDAFDRVRAVIWDQVRAAVSSWPDTDTEWLATLLERFVGDVQRQEYQPVQAPFNAPIGNVASKVPSR